MHYLVKYQAPFLFDDAPESTMFHILPTILADSFEDAAVQAIPELVKRIHGSNYIFFAEINKEYVLFENGELRVDPETGRPFESLAEYLENSGIILG